MKRMKDYASFYNHLTAHISCNAVYIRLLNILNVFFESLFYILYPLLLLYVFLYRKDLLMKIICVPGVSFVLLSYVRKIINRKRPYEEWDITPLIHKDKQGCSFPSRHVFSACIIASAYCIVNFRIGFLLLLMAAGTGLIRILGGVHYPVDVIAGYIAGLLAGLFLRL